MINLQTIRRELQRIPMVTALAVFVAGILFFDCCELPSWTVRVCFALGCVVAAAAPRSAAARMAVALSLFMFAGLVGERRNRESSLEMNELRVVTMDVTDIPSERANGGIAVPVRIEGERVMLSSDGSFGIGFGDRITALAAIRGFGDVGSGDDTNAHYGRLMRRRGFVGRIFLRAADTLRVERGAVGRSVQAVAAERFSQLDLEPSVGAVAGAMGAGDRSRMTAELRDAYARSGVSHLLAVSGLHIGIVFLIANALFRFLTIFRHGQVLACIAVLIPVWLYAAACGFSPSVVRAAVMFTMLQISKACNSAYSSPNVLAATAFVMLAANPDTLFDISFQLSFAAVAAIVVVGMPLMERVRHRTLPERFLWACIIIGGVSFAATAPLTAYFFGRLSVAGLIVNPIVIMCAYVIVGVSMLWLAAPLPLLKPAVETVLNFAGVVQNSAVEKIVSYEYLWFDVRISESAVIFIYLLLAVLAAVLYGRIDDDYTRRT